jgi:capsular polysaccharide biosynthesis protein
MAYRYAQFTPLLNGWVSIVLSGVIGTALAILLSFLRPLEYSSTTRILITQELGAVDAYTASRSAERIADDLASIVYTSTFFTKVLSSGYDVDESYFSDDEIKRRDQWEKAVSASVSRSSGLLSITAYHTDIEQAEELATAVAYVLTTEGWTYTSGGSITVQVVDEPLNSRYPVRPNLLINGFSGLVLGLLGGAGYLLITAEKLRRRHQFMHDDA